MTPHFSRLRWNQPQLPEEGSDFMTARHSLTVQQYEIVVDAPIPIRGVRQRPVSNPFTVQFTPLFTGFFPLCMQTCITQLPVRHPDVPAETVQAHSRLVFKHLGIEIKGLLHACCTLKDPGLFLQSRGTIPSHPAGSSSVHFLSLGPDAVVKRITAEADRPYTGAVLSKKRARPASRNCVRHLWIRLSATPC